MIDKEIEIDTSKGKTNIQFNDDGSLKLPEHILKLQQNEKESQTQKKKFHTNS